MSERIPVDVEISSFWAKGVGSLEASDATPLAVAYATTGTNSWQTAALRGLAAGAAAVADVLTRL